jgi:hypothetical protein
MKPSELCSVLKLTSKASEKTDKISSISFRVVVSFTEIDTVVWSG